MLEKPTNLVPTTKMQSFNQIQTFSILSPNRESKQDNVRKKITALGMEWPFKDQLIAEQTIKLESEGILTESQILAENKPAFEGFRDQAKSNSAEKRKRRHYTRKINNMKEDLKTQTQIYSQFDSDQMAHSNELNIQSKHK